MGLVEAYAQYSPQDTLLTAVFDPEIDSSERQDNELLNALEYYIAKRTNMYDNVQVIWIAGGSRGGSTAFYLMRKIKDRLMGEYGVDHYHDSPLTIKLLATGIDAVSQANDVQGCSPNISGYRRLVTNAWNLGDSTHGNGHNMNVLFDQAGTGFHPNLHALQIIGEVRNRDSMIHIEADSSSAEQDARLPAIRDADPDVIYEDLVYKYPENGLEGGFYSQWWPVFTTSPTDAPYEHDHLTRDYRPPNGPKTLNWFFNNAGWGDFIDYDGLQSCHPEVCDNGMDDDHDGYTDCQDVRSCRYDDHCNERNFCTNGADDDHDGLVDCEDPDCTPRARSFGEPCYTVHQDCTLRNPDPGTCRRAGDGYADLAIGVPLEDIGGATDAGAVNILYGSSPSGLTAAGSAIWGQFADSAEDDDKFGHSLAAGDFDGDGYMDLAIGVPGETVGSVTDAGAVNIMYGAAGGFFSARAEIWHQDTGSIHSLAETGDRFGYTLAVGDFNGDGRDDLAVGLPYEDWNETDAGIVQILYGSDTGLTDSGNQLWRQGSDGITEPEEPRDRFGFALAAGDFDRDGYADLAIGAPEEDFEEVPVNGVGVVHILHGSAAGLTSANWQAWRQIEADTNDRFGYTLTTGDFDGDGYADLAVGAPYEEVGLPEVRDAGAEDVLYGSAAGLSATGHQILDGGNGAEGDDRFGFALTGGDFNGDGHADLAVGIPYEDLPAGATDVLDAGAVEIFYGAPGGLIRRVANDFWHQDRSGMEDQPQANDLFGRALASGDFDGDGYADLAVGIPFKDIHSPGDNEGAVHILYGSADGISSAGCWFFHQDTTGIGGNAQPRDNFGKALAAIPLIRIRAYLPLVLHDYP
jgi:hypothetical protein